MPPGWWSPATWPDWPAPCRELRDDPARRADLGAAGIGRARRYAWTQVARRQLALYEQVVEDVGGAVESLPLNSTIPAES